LASWFLPILLFPFFFSFNYVISIVYRVWLCVAAPLRGRAKLKAAAQELPRARRSHSDSRASITTDSTPSHSRHQQ
jgi:hypothetical protein